MNKIAIVLLFLVILAEFGYIRTLNQDMGFWKNMSNKYQKESQDNADLVDAKVLKLNDCDATNYDLTNRLQFKSDQNSILFDHYIDTFNRLKVTTDLVESIYRCANNRVLPINCGRGKGGPDFDIVKYLEDNREGNF